MAGLILPMLHDRDASVRATAAHMLPVTGEDRVVTALLDALKDPAPQVRIAAAKALPATADSRTIEPLLAALADPEPLVRVAAMEALIQSYDRRAKEPLFALFQDKSAQVRQAAIEQLGGIPSRSVMGLLITAMKDQDADVRATATVRLHELLYSLGKKPTAVHESFTAALQDPSPTVRVAALGLRSPICRWIRGLVRPRAPRPGPLRAPRCHQHPLGLLPSRRPGPRRRPLAEGTPIQWCAARCSALGSATRGKEETLQTLLEDLTSPPP